MPPLELRETPVGPVYHLEGQPLKNGDLILMPSPWAIRADGLLGGRFAWNGLLEDRPWILSTGFGCAVDEAADVLWAETPVQLGAEPPAENPRQAPLGPRTESERRAAQKFD